MEPKCGGNVMEADEVHDRTGALSPTSASLSTNATAFCIASLIGASDRGDGDDGLPRREQDASIKDSDDDGNEFKITSEVSYISISKGRLGKLTGQRNSLYSRPRCILSILLQLLYYLPTQYLKSVPMFLALCQM